MRMQLVEYVSLIKETYYKHIPVNKEEFGIHVSYLYNRRQDYHLNGIAGGITYSCLLYTSDAADE